jgi:hypothetical protein
MFDRELDAIPWTDLRQCFGSAVDVPRLLRAMRYDAPRPESGGNFRSSVEPLPAWRTLPFYGAARSRRRRFRGFA